MKKFRLLEQRCSKRLRITCYAGLVDTSDSYYGVYL